MTMRFPIALWQDFSGTFTASVLDGAKLAAYDRTAAGALAQLEKYIAWEMRKEESRIHESDLLDLELRDCRVEIRPEYRINETAFPIPTTFVFRVTCIDGKRRDGTRHCVAPTLGIRRSYQEGDPIDRLMLESLQQALGRRTPQELSRELMPPQITLGAVHVKQREVAKNELAGRFGALQSIATLLGKRRRGVREVRARP